MDHVRLLTRLRACAALAALLLAGHALGAQAASGPSRPDSAATIASARAEIDAANAGWLPGIMRHDAASIAAVYADSGLFILADGTVIRGRAAVASMYEKRFEHLPEVRGGAIVQEGLAVIGPGLITEWGHGWLETVAAGGPPARTTSSYLTVWQRAGDGHWHIARNLVF